MRITPAFTIGLLFWSLSTSSFATQIPVITGTVPGFTDPGNVVLFEDDGNGIYDPGAEQVVAVISSVDGSFHFDSLSLHTQYFVAHGDNVSELVSPSELVASLDEFVGSGESEASPSNVNATTILLGDAVGGGRRLATSLDQGHGYIELAASSFDDTIRYAVGTGAQGTGIITWDGATDDSEPLPAMALNGIDLTAAGTIDAFAIYTGFDSASIGGEFALRLFKQGESTYSEIVLPLPINGGTATELVTFPFADFTGPVSADDVDSIQLVIQNASGGSDGQIAEFGLIQTEISPVFSGSVVAVSEPHSSLPSAILLGAFVFIRKRHG